MTFPATVNADELISVVQQAGYTAAVPEPGPGETSGDQDEARQAASLRRRLLVSLMLAVPVVMLAMIPALQFRYWQWVSLALATPVAAWGA